MVVHASNPGAWEVEARESEVESQLELHQTLLKTNRQTDKLKNLENPGAWWVSWWWSAHLRFSEPWKQTHWRWGVARSYQPRSLYSWRLCSLKHFKQKHDAGTLSMAILLYFHISTYRYLVICYTWSQCTQSPLFWPPDVAYVKVQPTEATVASQLYQTLLKAASASPRHRHFFIGQNKDMLIRAPAWGQCCWLLPRRFTLTQTNESCSYTKKQMCWHQPGIFRNQVFYMSIYRRLYKLLCLSYIFVG